VASHQQGQIDAKQQAASFEAELEAVKRRARQQIVRLQKRKRRKSTGTPETSAVESMSADPLLNSATEAFDEEVAAADNVEPAAEEAAAVTPVEPATPVFEPARQPVRARPAAAAGETDFLERLLVYQHKQSHAMRRRRLIGICAGIVAFLIAAVLGWYFAGDMLMELLTGA
jgi:hypothetical protein